MATTPEDARIYLSSILVRQPGGLAAASRKLNRNHAYLQQYVRDGKPLWLAEQDRETLVRLYGLDGDRLKPPAGSPRLAFAVPHSNDQGEIDAPRLGKFIDDPGKLELLEVWDAIDPRQRPLAMTVLRGFVAHSGSIIA